MHKDKDIVTEKKEKWITWLYFIYSKLVFTQDGVGVVFRSTERCDPVKQGPHSKFLSGGEG